MLGNARTAIMAAIAASFAGSFDRGFFTGSRTASIGRRNGSRNRNRRRNALRHGRGDGYEMHDGILHKQSNNWRMPNLRGYPGAKMARKAAQGKIGKRA